jgi:hypothetical protein
MRDNEADDGPDDEGDCDQHKGRIPRRGHTPQY